MSKVEKTRDNLLKCLCKKCPTYSFTCKMMSIPGNIILLINPEKEKPQAETLFCAYTKSQCIEEKKGCLCTQCEVYKENGLAKKYYCLADGGE
ncbi:MAG: DUF2769 domain-containing protein [Bacillota bacterium]